jgi:hypothetical protein
MKKIAISLVFIACSVCTQEIEPQQYTSHARDESCLLRGLKNA